ncbi:hypothetical protein V8F33_004613 [Rhypophila sp. PSN 637]
MATTNTHYVMLFGGQGSASIFSASTAATAERDALSTSAGNVLLSRCHAAFLEDMASLDNDSTRKLDIDLASFPSPSSLVRPPTRYHTHPVLQATNIFLCQLLHYLAETNRLDTKYTESIFENIQETAGFSSGILPATVVSLSQTVDQLVACGVQAFRLALWIAARTHLYVLSEHDESKDPEQREDDRGKKTKSPTLSLVIRGLTQTGITIRMAQYNSSRSKSSLSISAITSHNVISISGPKQELYRFQKNHLSDVATTFAFVHGWYHGGTRLQCLVQQVIDDCERRGISFPVSLEKKKPIRSSNRDGSLFYPTKPQDVLTWLAEHLLVHCVDWCCTTRAMVDNINDYLDKNRDLTVKIMSFGPGSNSLFPQPANHRTQLADLSPFKPLSLNPQQQHKDSIAIVGMSVNLPQGQSPTQLWETLASGLSTVSPIPSSRFNVSSYPSSIPPGGCFLPDSAAFAFDNTFFSTSPREALSMDPQQRMLLTAAHHALSDAGYVPDSTPTFARSSMGCYVGLATGDYTANLGNNADHPGIDVYYSTGTLRAFAAGRISYFYKWSGPAIVTDTACSSSMVSIYHAVRALQGGDCKAALAGGANVITAPDMYLGLARGHFLSKKGEGCRPFDREADGYTRAEGCVMFVLKRLEDAVNEGDRIWGVIRGVEVNQSGEASSITHPHSRTQTGLLRKLMEKTGVDVKSVGVVEAHGTGTQAGDAREVESLGAVFEGRGTGREVCLGSVKGSIGHCEAASGAAGLAKLVLMFKERQIPPQVGFKTVNPALEGTLERAGLVIPTRLMPWIHELKTPRRALLNNFGAAGSNGSLLLEDWVVDSKEAKERSAYLFALSAKSEKALRWSVREHIGLLSGPKPPLLRDVCYTSAARRQVYGHRIATSCSSVQDLVAKLKQYQSQQVSMTRPAPKVSKIVFAFAGQGSWSDGVGRELLDTFPPFRDIIEECDRIIKSLDSDYRYPSIFAFLLQGAEQWSDSDKIIASQCACVALQVALARTFMSCGIKPDYIMGHSLGEYAALHIAGVLSLHDTLLVVAGRSRLMTEKCLAGTSGMLACNMSLTKTQQVILSRQDLAQLSVACHNSPADCVVGGPLEQLSLFQAECREAKTKALDIPFAFHTSALDPILESLEELGRGIKFGQAEIPVLSNVHGRFFEDHDLDSSYFALHARQRVRFADMLECLQHQLEQQVSSNGHTLFMDIGPHPTTLPMLRASLPSSPNHVYLGTLQKGKESWKSMTESLAAICLCELPRPVNWRPIFTGTSARVTSLPAHLLEGSTYLVPYQEPALLLPKAEAEPDSRIRTGFYLLPWAHPSSPGADGLLLETDLTILGPLISGHDVGGTCICPASVFHELAIEAADVMFRPQAPQVLTVQGLRFANPLVYVPQEETTPTTRLVLVSITRRGPLAKESAAEFKITSRSALDTSAKETEHCSGSISVQSLHPGSKQWIRDEALVLRQSHSFSRHGHHHSGMSTFRPKVLYEAVFTRVVRYTAEYQSLTYLDVADSNLEGLGQFQVPSNGSEAAADGYLTHPVFTDTLLHAAGFIANLHMAMDSKKEQMIGICARVESIEIAYSDIDVSKGVFTIYCSLLEINGAKSVLADTVVLDEAGKVVAVVRGIEFRKLRLPVFHAALARHRDDCHATDMARKSVRTGREAPPGGGDINSPITASTSSTDFIRSSVWEIVVQVGGFQGGQERVSTVLSTKSLDELGIDSMMRIEIAAKLSRVFPGQALEHHTLDNCDTVAEMQEALGIDSMMRIEIAGKLSSQLFPSPQIASLDHHALEGCNTLDEMQAVVLAAAAAAPGRSTSLPSSPSRSNPVTLYINPSTVQSTPLVLFHDGSGQITPYARLTAHDRTTHAFFDPSFGLLSDDDKKKRLFTSIAHMARHYISLLMPTLDKKRPIILGGWSFGGVVAFEAAKQLISRGFEVKGLVLIDVPSPVDHEPLPEIIIDSICKGSSDAVKQEFLYNASLLGMYKPGVREAVRLDLKTVMLQSRELFDTEEELGVRYEWLSQSEARTRALKDWEVLTGGQVVQVLYIPGNHFGAFDQCHVQETSKQLWKACRIIEQA